MLSDHDSLAVLRELKQHIGSNRRLAEALNVTEKSVAEWLRANGTVRLHNENKQRILDLAKQYRIDVQHFAATARLWDWNKTYGDNLEREPELLDLGLIEPQVPVQFLGFELSSPFGASASVLTSTAARVRQLLHTGAGLVTYKTVRSRALKSHPSPNILACIGPPNVGLERAGVFPNGVVVDTPETTSNWLGMLNRFGMPSAPPEVWQADFARARSYVLPGQLLALSVVGTSNNSERQLVDDFRQVVALAVEAGAQVIELNGSCPNCEGPESHLFENVALLEKVCRAAREVAPDSRLLLKIGYLDRTALASMVSKTSKFVDGYSAINSVPVAPFRDGQHGMVPAYGPGVVAGLSGTPVRASGLSVVRELARLRDAAAKPFAIIGVGGVSRPADVLDYMSHGADVVQASTVFFADASFAVKVRRALAAEGRSRERQLEAERRTAVMNVLVAAERLSPSVGNADAHRLAVEVVAEWQKGQVSLLAAGPRRALPVPTADEFERQILKRRR